MLFERDGNAIAESELVAAIAEEMLGADDKALTRLVQKKPGVAQRIAETIKRAIDRFRGVKDAELDNMRRVEKLLRKALDDVERQRRAEYRNGVKVETDGGMRYALDERGDWADEPGPAEYTIPGVRIEQSFDTALTRDEFRVLKEIITGKPKEYMSVRDIGRGVQKMIPVTYHDDQTKLVILSARDGQYEITDVYQLNVGAWDGPIMDLLDILEGRLKRYGNRSYESWSENLREIFGAGLFSRYDQQALRYPSFDSEGTAGRTQQSTEGQSGGRGDHGNAGVGDSGRAGSGVEDIQYALPNGDLIDQQIDSWLSSRSALEPRNKLADPNGQNQQTTGDGKCQFATKTAQQSQALQARKLFSRMTPTGLKARVAAQSETKTAEYMRTHKPAMEDIRKRAGKAAEKLKGKRGSDELLRLNSSGDYVIDGRSSKWGVPINEQQALIDHDKLGKVARPGLFYNRATTEQRMLVSEEARAFFILPGYTDFCTRYYPQAPRSRR